MHRIFIGTWTLPSGNSCDVTLEADARGVADVSFAWDSPPPLAPEDEADYTKIVRPAVIAAALRYMPAVAGRSQVAAMLCELK